MSNTLPHVCTLVSQGDIADPDRGGFMGSHSLESPHAITSWEAHQARLPHHMITTLVVE